MCAPPRMRSIACLCPTGTACVTLHVLTTTHLPCPRFESMTLKALQLCGIFNMRGPAFLFNDPVLQQIYTLSLHGALSFFFEEPAAYPHSPFSPARRLPL